MKLTSIIKAFLLASLCLITIGVYAVETENTHTNKRIMFIGNSFSFYNNGVHNHLGGLVRSAGDWSRAYRFRLNTLSGGRLQEHTAQLKNILSAKNANWDTVVLQPHSNEAISKNRAKAFELALSEQVNIVRNAGAEPLLFMTWAYKGDNEMHKQLLKAYTEAGAKYDLRLIPVGNAFQKAQQHLPNIELYVADVLSVDANGHLTYRTDIKHPSPAGSYLAACVFYAALYKKSPEDLLFVGGVGAETAKKLQRIAWQTVEQFNAD